MDSGAGLTTVAAALEQSAKRLKNLGDTPELDAQVLLAEILSRPRSWLPAHPEAKLDDHILEKLENSLQRLEAGVPLAYVLGKWQFFGMTYEVTQDVLIPRPETELLVERAVSWLQEKLEGGRACCALDIGTGSGCIAVSLAVHVPRVQVFATDLSMVALSVARRNATRLLGDDRVTMVRADLFPGKTAEGTEELPDRYDLVIANLPYIPTRALAGLAVSTREPALALHGGEDGLDLIRRVLDAAPDHLAKDGLLLLEIEASQGEAVTALAANAFPQAMVHLHQDLTGRDRMVEIQNGAGGES
jgi:release factor glutamine methyltransferase